MELLFHIDLWAQNELYKFWVHRLAESMIEPKSMGPERFFLSEEAFANETNTTSIL